MNWSVSRILLALSVIGGLYFLIAEDDPVEHKEASNQKRLDNPAVAQHRETSQTDPQHGWFSQAPMLPPTYSNRFEQPSQAGNTWDWGFPEPRFRPMDKNSNTTGGSPSETRQRQQDNPAFTYDPPTFNYPDYRNQGQQTPPSGWSGRFRPLDEKRQSKRWHGNYRRMSTWPEQLVAPNRSASYFKLAGSPILR